MVHHLFPLGLNICWGEWCGHSYCLSILWNTHKDHPTGQVPPWNQQISPGIAGHTCPHPTHEQQPQTVTHGGSPPRPKSEMNHRRGPCDETGTHIPVPATPRGLSAPTGVGGPSWAWKCPWIWTGSEKKLCLTLGDPMNCSPPWSSVHGILQARILERAAISFSRGFSWPRVSCIEGSFFAIWVTREAQFGQGGILFTKGLPLNISTSKGSSPNTLVFKI